MNYKKMYPRYLWMIPLIIYTLFYILPGILGIYYSFVNYTIYNDSKEFVGFANYIQMFSQNRFRVGLGNTLLFAEPDRPGNGGCAEYQHPFQKCAPHHFLSAGNLKHPDRWADLPGNAPAGYGAD